MFPSDNKSLDCDFPSYDTLAFRTGTQREGPSGPEAYFMQRGVGPAFHHRLEAVWEDMGGEILKCLDSAKVMWTSVDIVRFDSSEAKENPRPVVIWIGIKPKSLSCKDAQAVAGGCEKILNAFEVTGVDIGFRESILTGLGAFQPLQDVPSTNAAAEGTGSVHLSDRHGNGASGPISPASTSTNSSA